MTPAHTLSCPVLLGVDRNFTYTTTLNISKFTLQDYFSLSLLFSWTVENADMRLPGIVHFPVLLLLPHSYKLQNGSGMFTIHHKVPKG